MIYKCRLDVCVADCQPMRETFPISAEIKDDAWDVRTGNIQRILPSFPEKGNVLEIWGFWVDWYEAGDLAKTSSSAAVKPVSV